MDSYSRIKLNIVTAKIFRKFSEQIAGSHSEALTIMMDFFDQKISPSESLGPNMKSFENNLKSRINGLIAIIRNIENNHTKPTVAMQHLLFEQAEPKNKPLILENNIFLADVPKAPVSYNKNQT